MGYYVVQYESDGEISEYDFYVSPNDSLDRIIQIALSELFLNDCCPGEDWRILKPSGSVLDIPWNLLHKSFSSAAHYYNRPEEDWG